MTEYCVDCAKPIDDRQVRMLSLNSVKLTLDADCYKKMKGSSRGADTNVWDCNCQTGPLPLSFVLWKPCGTTGCLLASMLGNRATNPKAFMGLQGLANGKLMVNKRGWVE